MNSPDERAQPFRPEGEVERSHLTWLRWLHAAARTPWLHRFRERVEGVLNQLPQAQPQFPALTLHAPSLEGGSFGDPFGDHPRVQIEIRAGGTGERLLLEIDLDAARDVCASIAGEPEGPLAESDLLIPLEEGVLAHLVEYVLRRSLEGVAGAEVLIPTLVTTVEVATPAPTEQEIQRSVGISGVARIAGHALPFRWVVPRRLIGLFADADEGLEVSGERVELQVRLAQVDLSAEEIQELKPGALLELGREVDEPVAILRDGEIVGSAEMMVCDGEMMARIRRLELEAED